MEKEDLVERLIEFLNECYKNELLTAINEGKKSVEVDFSLLDKFDVELADYLLENPEEAMLAVEEALKQIDVGLPDSKLKIRFYNLPESRNIRIRNIRAEHIGKMIVVDGIVKRASEVRPEVSEAVFQCPECGRNITIIQTERFVNSPIECECGNRKGFRLTGQKLYDARWVMIEEPYEVVTGEKPSEIMVYLKEDLTSPRMQNKTDPGNRIKIVGTLKELPRRIKGSRSRQMDIFIDANHIESVEAVWEELEITPEDEKKIVEVAKDPQVFDNLIASIAPSMYGLEDVKEAMALQLFGADPKLLKDKTRIRGNIHILLVGDPSSGKSQLMQLISKLIPRGKYVSGSGITAAGITATVVKDEEFLGGWVLEAGALVMANRSICCIDEFSKVSPQDRVALQEAMSLESYHPDTEITLLDGTSLTIQQLVEGLFEKYKDRIKTGVECLWLEVPEDIKILTTDSYRVYPTRIVRVSKHKAPQYFYKIRIATGRELIVTPNHPCFVLDGEIKCVSADKIKPGDYFPIPSTIPLEGAPQEFELKEREVRSQLSFARHISIPTHNSPDFCKFLGYLVTEGCGYTSSGREYGICFTNSKESLLEDFKSATKRLFGLSPSQTREKEGAVNVYYNSVELFNFLQKIEPKILARSWEKELPKWVKKLPKEEIRSLLKAAFDGDGCAGKGYVYFTTTSKKLALQVQELLNILGVLGYLRKRLTKVNRVCWDVVIKGSENLRKFVDEVGFSDGEKNRKIISYVKRASYRKSLTNTVPNIQDKVKFIMERFKAYQKEISGEILTNHFKHKNNFTVLVLRRVVKNFFERVKFLENARKKIVKAGSRSELKALREEVRVSTFEIAKEMDVCHQMISYLENKSKNFPLEKYKAALLKCVDRMLEHKKDVEELKKLAFSQIRWVPVTSVEKIKNDSTEWVYDVTTENERFISNCMVLHNTISIAKASIVATLPAQTAVLAGGNPKLGRFDPYIPIREQVDIDDVLLSRFDLKFALRDVPDSDTDRRVADHILRMRQFEEETKPLLGPEFIRKWIAYARAHVHPKLTPEAGNKLKEFYLEMRLKAGEEAPVAITLRQYEALLRLAEAAARVRLSENIEMEDAERAIRLMKVSLRQFGFEPETGAIDIDRAEGARVTSAQRSKIRIVLDIIEELSNTFGKEIPSDEIIKKAKEQKVEHPEEILRKMQYEGMVYSPRNGFVSKV